MSTASEPDESSLPTAQDSFFEHLNASRSWTSAWEPEHDWYHYVTGYKYAADVLVAHLETAGRLAYKLGPPIVFLYRHHLELALKQFARQCGDLLGRDVGPLIDHRLNHLWRFCLSLLAEISPGGIEGAEMQETTRLLEEFDSVDLASQAFRYPEEKDGSPSPLGLKEIDLGRVCKVADKISLLLDCIAADLETRE